MAFRLFVFDLEGTLLRPQPSGGGRGLVDEQHSQGLWFRLVNALGPAAVAADEQLARNWDAGQYASYTAWCNDSLKNLRKFGLTRTLFEKLSAAFELNDGVEDTVRELQRRGVVTVIVTGGFVDQARRTQHRLGIPHAYAAVDLVWNPDGSMAFWNVMPSDFRGKAAFLRALLEDYGVRPSECAFVGDGANDIHIATYAGTSYAYRASPRLAAVSTHVITEFSEILKGPGVYEKG